VFDIYTLIFLALAVFIFLRLRSVLGQRSGSERPPYDLPSSREAINREAGANGAADKVVPLTPRGREQGAEAALDIAAADAREAAMAPGERWKDLIVAGLPGAGLDALIKADRNFDLGDFMQGARSAYEMIVTAFAGGERRTLKDLLSSEVYSGFDAAIGDREARGEVAETRFVSIDDAKLIDAAMEGRTAQLTVRFVSQIISVTRDKDGNVVDGNADKVTDVTDVWTFARDMSSRDPNWKLVGTEAAS